MHALQLLLRENQLLLILFLLSFDSFYCLRIESSMHTVQAAESRAWCAEGSTLCRADRSLSIATQSFSIWYQSLRTQIALRCGYPLLVRILLRQDAHELGL